MSQKIVPCIWFDGNAEGAVNFYSSVFKNFKVLETLKNGKSSSEASGSPEGSILTISFELEGMRFLALNGGPEFKPNPSISFFITCKEGEIDGLWDKLSEGGKVLMPLQQYPFSKKYGWIEDKFGVSWQLIIFNPEGDKRPVIIPSLMFTKENAGKAEEATDFYISIFKDSREGMKARYPANSEPDKEGTLMFSDFNLSGEWFAAMDSAREHDFSFGEGISLMVNCKNQEEIDYFWSKLSAHPEAEQCGWLKDKYGVSWQIIPENMNELIKSEEGMKAMIQMKKIEIEKLKEAGK